MLINLTRGTYCIKNIILESEFLDFSTIVPKRATIGEEEITVRKEKIYKQLQQNNVSKTKKTKKTKKDNF